jgi:hypothetical protein
VGALLASSFVSGCAVEDSPEGAPGGEASGLQQRVDEVLAANPGGHQVSATELDYDGAIVTFDPSYSAKTEAFAPASIPSCANGWFCIVVNGTKFEFFKCQTWNLTNWTGTAPFNNNQTPGTVARAFGIDGGLRWSDTAKHTGTANVNSWFTFKPC